MASLFELTNEFQLLYQMMTDPDADVQCINDTLDALTGELEVKSSGYVAVIHQLEMEQQKAEELAKELKAKADIRKNNIKRLKDALKYAMMTTGKTEIDANGYTIKLQNNGGKKPLQIIGEVPDNFKRIILEDDTELIRKHLEDGEKLDFAYLEERGKHIVIK
jgi:hypothetical protein